MLLRSERRSRRTVFQRVVRGQSARCIGPAWADNTRCLNPSSLPRQTPLAILPPPKRRVVVSPEGGGAEWSWPPRIRNRGSAQAGPAVALRKSVPSSARYAPAIRRSGICSRHNRTFCRKHSRFPPRLLSSQRLAQPLPSSRCPPAGLTRRLPAPPPPSNHLVSGVAAACVPAGRVYPATQRWRHKAASTHTEREQRFRSGAHNGLNRAQRRR
jgi:hypothetical protein